MAAVVILHVAYPNRCGKGKTHLSGGPYRDTLCAEHIHGHRKQGTPEDVTCKKCLRIAIRLLEGTH